MSTLTDGADLRTVALGAIAGLTLFLYGLNVLSDALRAVAGERMKRLLARMTANRLSGLITGIVVTTVLDSSSATTILLVGLVSSGLLEFERAPAVVLGANIGTTVSSQIIAFQVTEYAPMALLVGFLMHSLARCGRWQSWGMVVLSLGLVFFGLETIGRAMAPVQDHPDVEAFLARMSNPLWGVLAGAVFTALIQSSSAMMGIIITLADQGTVPLPAAVAMMMGAEIGTCADTLIASVGRPRAAVRVGLFQLLFNVACVAVGIWFVGPLADLAVRLSPGGEAGGGTPRQIANAHVLFNVFGALLFLGFTSSTARLLERLVPDKPAGTDLDPASGSEVAEAPSGA